MSRRVVLFLLLLIVVINLKAQQAIKLLVFTEVSDTHDKSDYFEIKSTLDIKHIVDQFVIKQWNEGYINLQLIEERQSHDTVYHFYLKGERYLWDNIRYKNAEAQSVSKINLNWTEISPVNIVQSIHKVLSYYENNGFPFVSVKLDSVKIKGAKVDALIDIDKGKQYVIDSIICRGSAKISKKYVSNLIGIKEGDIYNESEIRDIDKKLKNNFFFKTTKPSIVVFSPTSSKVIVFIDKVQSSKFDGLIGFYPDETSGKIQLTGDMQLHLANSVAHAEVFDLKWKKLSGKSQELNTSLEYPYLFNTVFGVSGMLNMLKQDTNYLNLNQKLGVFYLFNSLNHLKLFVNRRTSTVLTTSKSTATMMGISNYSTLLFGASGQYVFLDEVLNPKRGLVLDFEGMAGNKKLGLEKTNTGVNVTKKQIILGLKAAKYFRVSNKFVYKLSSQFQSMVDNQIYTNELFRVGGLKTLRGFDEQSIYASDYAFFSNELRLLMDRASYLFVFVDGGWYQNRNVSKPEIIHDTPWGTGAGISFDTKAGVFSISYALGKQFGNPFDVKNGKIHFGINTVF